MTDKSYVTLEQRVCVVCGKRYDTGDLLLDKRLRKSFHMHTTTGWGMCAEHEKLRTEGYVALVECDPAKTTRNHNGNVMPEDAHRTGTIVHVRSTVYQELFNIPLPKDMVCFIEPEVVAVMRRLSPDVDATFDQQGGERA